MATTTTEVKEEEVPPKITTLFNTLDKQKHLLTKCTDIYKTLTNHITTLQSSIQSKSQTLDTKLQTLDTTLTQTLPSRVDSLPARLISLSSDVESLKSAALNDPGVDDITNATLSDVVRSACRRMDCKGLMGVLVGKRRETNSLRSELLEGLKECVDPERFVVEVVREYVEMKRGKKGGLTDKRWACSMVVGSMFAPEDLKGGGGRKGGFSRMAVKRAEDVVREWMEVGGMAPAEAAMFVEFVVGFGLKEVVGEEFVRKLMVEFCGRRDMAKLAVPFFGNQVADLIEELVKNGKEIEAVYFSSESGLTERFQPVSLLKAALRNSKKNIADTLKKGRHTSAATDEANNLEITMTKSIIKCVEDHDIEAEFSVEGLRKRLAALEKAKTEKKKITLAAGHKRSNGAGGARASGPPSSRPAKVQKRSSPYAPYVGRDAASPALSPVSRYLGPYSYPSQTTYDAAVTQSAYGPSYGGSHIQAAAPEQITQQHYGIPAAGDSLAGAGPRHAATYSLQAGYGSYDYGANAPAAYGPPSYPQ